MNDLISRQAAFIKIPNLIYKRRNPLYNKHTFLL